ncbi:unnamed protein product [Dovyalis caffra]|uniref:HMA domain-containing protein n=1 Tax=Dovyalis caffra TaxID=77055 RepID=A0AAV1RWC5_9ROSI|nr:unnamed protein product [Dovyalis caffra]
MSEPKTEAKQEATTEAKQVVIEENTEAPLKYKKWVLKVSVHCEGCKKKVKKILNNIDGVYTTDVDLRQQKATVIGNVDADTLIKKLIKKTGKNAELWPEKADKNQKGKKKGKAKNKEKEKEKQSDQESSSEEGGDGENEKGDTVKTEVVKIQDRSPKKSENGSAGPVVIGKASEGGGVQVKEVKISEVSAKQPVTLPAGGKSPVADKKVGGESEVVAEKSGAGGGSVGGGSSSKKKKKKKKGNQGNNNSNSNGDEGNQSGHAPAGTGSPIHGHVQVQIPHPANQRPSRYHRVYDYPATTYYAPPVYAASSNVAYPSTSYGASYYAPQHSYAYVHAGTHPHPGAMSEPPPSDFDSYPSQPSDSFEIFSDENPNACSIM